ncbi:hypothetical protein SAMN02745118_00680 [Selenihalanaerobacter shriftii]|uniref:Uncharacterized protein n=2 Tax=Selenihalanaerobacter shriftii TaxID=142842 RepID=A0A1T4K8F9_9FIRM|nr:hypothetical protein SAMN02745118_00680 [Selenihalanaerobacter shriftii]
MYQRPGYYYGKNYANYDRNKQTCQPKEKKLKIKEQKSEVKDCILKVIDKVDKSDRITVILKSGDGCCLWCGCFGGVEDGWLYNIISFDDPTECRRMYIPLECICAIIDPEIEFDSSDQ